MLVRAPQSSVGMPAMLPRSWSHPWFRGLGAELVLGLYTPSTVGAEAFSDCMQQAQASHIASLGCSASTVWVGGCVKDPSPSGACSASPGVCSVNAPPRRGLGGGPRGRGIGAGSGQTQMHVDDGDPALLGILK